MSLQILTSREQLYHHTLDDLLLWTKRTAETIRSRPGGAANAVDPANILPPAPAHIATARPAMAYVSMGRWVVACPNGDGHAYSVQPGFPMYCIYCGNADIGGQWRAVAFPAFRDELEAMLSERPMRHQQNWTGEPLDVVRSEQLLGRNLTAQEVAVVRANL